jgi:hypothetical protein
MAPYPNADPTRQFALVREHINRIRCIVTWARSPVIFFIERNLGFEAEHHERELCIIENSTFFREPGCDRSGVLTTNDSKHGMCAMLNAMLREGRMHCKEPIFSRDSASNRAKLKEQLNIYSYQFKQAATTFQRDAVALSGKVGGMRDDLCICLQIGVLMTSPRR